MLLIFMGAALRAGKSMRAEIIYEDKALLVCKKPAGLAVQTAVGFQEDMVSELKNEISRRTGEKAPYLGVVHRLDQPVEGLLVFAKTRQAAAQLGSQLSDGRLKKHYLAVLSAVPQKEQDTLIDYLKKDARTNTSSVVLRTEKDAKRAQLSYKLLSVSKEGHALAGIEIATGRHHQIRVQMAHLGCPLVGDAKYGGTLMPEGGLALCADRLSFFQPHTKKRLEFSIKPQNPVFGEFG